MVETTEFVARLKALGLGEGWAWDKGAWWLDVAAEFDVRAAAETLRGLEARFVAITATEQADGTMRLDYQWDLDGELLSFKTVPAEKRAVSIADLVPAADWAERETYEYFAVEFTGRATMEPLMMRKGDEVGIHLKKEAVQ